MGRFLKILGVLIVAVLAAEAFARFVLEEKPGPFAENHLPEDLAKFVEFDPVLGVRYRINTDVLIDAPTGDFSFLFKTNEINLRDRPMGTHLRSELKFLVFGDEFAEGWGTDIDQTAVVVAQLLINEKTALNPPVRLVIAGKSGYGAAQNYLIANGLMETLKPKAVVFLYTSLMPHADHVFLEDAELDKGLATGLKADAAPTPRLPHGEDYLADPPKLLAKLAPYSAAVRVLARTMALRAKRGAITVGDPASDRLAGMRGEAAALAAAHEPSLRHVKALAELAERLAIPFLLVHLPLPPEVAAEEWSKGRQLFGVSAELQASDDIPVVQNFCAETKLKCMQAHELMQQAAAAPDSSPLFYRSELGFTPDGNRVLGAWLATALYDWMGELGYR